MWRTNEPTNERMRRTNASDEWPRLNNPHFKNPRFSDPPFSNPRFNNPELATKDSIRAQSASRDSALQPSTFQQPNASGWGSASTSPAFKISLDVHVAIRAGKATPTLFTATIALALSGAARAAGSACALLPCTSTLLLSLLLSLLLLLLLLLPSSGGDRGMIDRNRSPRLLSSMLGSMDGTLSDQKWVGSDRGVRPQKSPKMYLFRDTRGEGRAAEGGGGGGVIS